MQRCYGPHYVKLLDPDEMLHFCSYTVHQNTHLMVLTVYKGCVKPHDKVFKILERTFVVGIVKQF